MCVSTKNACQLSNEFVNMSLNIEAITDIKVRSTYVSNAHKYS